MTAGQRKLRRVTIGVTATLTLALVIAVLTLAPMPSGGPPGSDKLYHALAFGALAFPLPLVRPRMAIYVFLCVLVYGGVIELIQPYFGRSAEWADFWADGLGAALGATAGALLSGRVLAATRRRRHA